MKNVIRRVPVEQLQVAIVDLLKTGPHVIDAIARELGYSVSAVRLRLEQLQLENRAHRRRIKFEDWSGVCYAWYHGAALDAAIPPAATEAQVVLRPEDRGIVPNQRSMRTYPAITQRDPLVAALFGPVGQADA